jgi:hypothetical protein
MLGLRESRFRDKKWRFRAQLGVKTLVADASQSCHGRAKTSPFCPPGETPSGLPLDTATAEWLHIVGV